jgi:hypothetical protein
LKARAAGYLLLHHMVAEECRVLPVVDKETAAVVEDGVLGGRGDVAVN